MTPSAPETKFTYIDIEEVTVRIAEACMGNKRPNGVTTHQAIQALREIDRVTTDRFVRAAFAACEYIAECCNAVKPGSVELKRITIPDAEAVQ